MALLICGNKTKEGMESHFLMHFLDYLEGKQTEDHLKIRSQTKDLKGLSSIISSCGLRGT